MMADGEGGLVGVVQDGTRHPANLLHEEGRGQGVPGRVAGVDRPDLLLGQGRTVWCSVRHVVT